MRVGEPSSDSGIRGLSTNFAFLRGAKDKKRDRERGRGGKKREENRKEGRKKKERETEGKRRERET